MDFFYIFYFSWICVWVTLGSSEAFFEMDMKI